MKNLKWLGFLVMVLGILVFGNNSEAYASEMTDKEKEITFDLTLNEIQETSYINENGETVTIILEPINIPNNLEELLELEEVSTMSSSFLFPYGTTTGYKVSAFTPYMGLSFYVDVYIPSNIESSKFTKAYDPDYWVIGGLLENRTLTRTDKLVTYSGDFNVLGGLGGSNFYLKAHLNGNVIIAYELSHICVVLSHSLRTEEPPLRNREPLNFTSCIIKLHANKHDTFIQEVFLWLNAEGFRIIECCSNTSIFFPQSNSYS
jgi:hypothetical protein